MKKADFRNWLDQLTKVWESRQPELAASLVAKEFQYYESPVSQPITNKKKLVELWQPVPKLQQNVHGEYDILYTGEEYGIANYRVTLDRRDSGKHYIGSRIFLVSLNDTGQCTLFKQWRDYKEE